MSYFTYILHSESRDRFYIGSSSNVEERLIRHNAGATPSTKSGKPWKIVYSEVYISKTDALKREIFLKRMKSRVYLENLIRKSELGSSAG